MADAEKAAQVIEGVLKDAELEWESPAPGNYVVQLPGTRKLKTTVSLLVGRHSLSVNAFVIRHPDENEPGVHRWLLERNLKLYGVSYAVDQLGDIYVAGKLPLSAVTPDEIDRLLGQVLVGLLPGATPWQCRLCDLTACGRTAGACPVERAEPHSP
jgi:hypothetical protein